MTAKRPKRPKGGKKTAKKLDVKAIVRYVVQPQIERGDFELFHTPARQAYATLKRDGHFETYALQSDEFRDLLSHAIYATKGEMPSDATINKTIRVLTGKARYDTGSAERSVFLRIAEANGKVYLDLADDQWRIIEITPTGWWITEKAPVRFTRSMLSRPLPMPVPGGNLQDIFKLVHITNKDDQILFLGWLVGLLQNHAACPILLLLGGEGAAKTSACRIAAGLVDPSVPQLGKEPKSERDMLVASQYVHIVGFDNVSVISDKLSDALSRLVTGSGAVERKLYTNGGLFFINARNPVVMNAITLTATRGDLLDRMITLKLDRISDAKRLSDRKILQEFEARRPALLGALLTAASASLRNLPRTNIMNAPRLIDFTEYVVAARLPGDFLEAYRQNRRALSDASIEMVPEGLEIVALIDTLDGDGTFSYKDLLTRLNKYATEQLKKDPEWPKSERQLRAHLARIERGLFGAGYRVHWLKNDPKTRRAMVRIERTTRPEVKKHR